MFTAREIIDLAIRIERNGEKAYRKAVQQVSDPAVASLLQKLADDEAEHLTWFSEMRERLPDPAAEDGAIQEMAESVLGGILGDQSFSLEEADFSRVENLEELIDISIEFEKDTVLFYELIGSMATDPPTLEHLRTIVKEENRHIDQLAELQGSLESHWGGRTEASGNRGD